MQIQFNESVEFEAQPDAVWSVLVDIEQMSMFQGFGPIPGIAQAQWIEGEGCRAGSIREVHNRDGSRHREEVVRAEPSRLLEDRIYGFTSPFRLLVSEARDLFELSANGRGTTLSRTFCFTLRSPFAYPLAACFLPMMRSAVRRHHALLRGRFTPG